MFQRTLLATAAVANRVRWNIFKVFKGVSWCGGLAPGLMFEAALGPSRTSTAKF
jgi:hypothetical protein